MMLLGLVSAGLPHNPCLRKVKARSFRDLFFVKSSSVAVCLVAAPAGDTVTADGSKTS